MPPFTDQLHKPRRRFMASPDRLSLGMGLWGHQRLPLRTVPWRRRAAPSTGPLAPHSSRITPHRDPPLEQRHC